MSDSDLDVDLNLIERIREEITPHVVQTPLYRSTTLSEILDTDLHLKLENRQFTSSFKERGAVARLSALTAEERAKGVIAMSAGNHAQALAYHARRMGVNATIVMPRTTPVAKIDQTRYFQPEIVLHGSSFDETIEYVDERRIADDLTLIHPFDDTIVMAGQGSTGLEIVEQLPHVDTVVVPVGGGGLISGIGTAIKALKPSIRIVGVQSAHYCPVYAKLNNEPWKPERNQLSIAEGIAIKRPGKLTMPIVERVVDDMVTVTESSIETAMFRFLDIEKMLVEGAGAATLAAVAAHPDVAKGKTVCVVSGGNVDPAIVADIIQRTLVRTERIVRLHSTVQDVPGSLTKLTNDISDTDSNIVDIYHRRSFGSSTLDATVVEIIVQLRGEDDKVSLIRKLRELGHTVGEPDQILS
ncbi:MAG: threonine ammonia-lyase [Pseudomonadales bacterium]|nr:threonine ammonia-lyase [Pseudomonadales bacterium]